MRKSRRWLLSLLLLPLALSLIEPASAASAARADTIPASNTLVYPCQAQPCWQDQALAAFDGTGTLTPIFGVPLSGGDVKVFGTGFGVMPPGQTDQAQEIIGLTDTGTIVINGDAVIIFNGVRLTKLDVMFGHCMEHYSQPKCWAKLAIWKQKGIR